ncbi:unnamed protein product [Polarella glacialis]|uniref:Steroid 5-alpha reductase C-terminal domain-containing protein n=2 Tax=Polarella glacialis TaxID=89957 RepID=A0A813FVH3_POLGL|nr:unnamed protein product [Polarella glacialis]
MASTLGLLGLPEWLMQSLPEWLMQGELSSVLVNLRAVVAICFCIQWLVYAVHGCPFRSEKYYDLTGSCTFALAVMYSFLQDFDNLSNWRACFLSAAVLGWCSRLGMFLFARIQRDGHDRRMDKIKANRLVFLAAWNMQGTWCLTAGLPAYVVNSLKPFSGAKLELSVLDFLGVSLWLFGWLLEIVADRQKFAFRNDPANKDRFISTGLWAWSRHPNYFGEMTLWLGLSLVAFTSLEGYGTITRCSVIASPVFTTGLLSFLSGLPLLEKYADKKWGEDPAYLAYKRSTPLLIPLPPKLAPSSKDD